MRINSKISNLLRRQVAAGNLAQVNLLILLAFFFAMAGWFYPALFKQQGSLGTNLLDNRFRVTMKQSLGAIGGPLGKSEWVSAAIFDTVAEQGFPFVLQTSAQRRNLLNQEIPIAAEWAAADPNIVQVAGITDKLNSITILRQGETVVMAAAQGRQILLYVSAAYVSPRCDQVRVIIAQVKQPALEPVMCKQVLPLVIK
jgi:hypothetical protein